MQFGRLGLASYHFRAADDCYISYEDAPSSWRLDDGSIPPAVKRFDSPSWDAATRTFTGFIDWSANMFHGDARWEYTMRFSESFEAMEGGGVRSFRVDGTAGPTHRFGTGSVFGALFGARLVYTRHAEERAENLARQAEEPLQVDERDAQQREVVDRERLHGERFHGGRRRYCDAERDWSAATTRGGPNSFGQRGTQNLQLCLRRRTAPTPALSPRSGRI